MSAETGSGGGLSTRMLAGIVAIVAIVIVVVVVVVVLGGDDEADGGDSTALSQSFSGEISGITVEFNYPDGWFTEAGDEQIAVANQEEILPTIGDSEISADDLELPDDAVGFQLIALPSPGATPLDMVSALQASGGPADTEVGEPEEITIGDAAAAKAALSGGDVTGEVIIIEYEDALVIIGALSNNYDAHAATINDIAESVSVALAE